MAAVECLDDKLREMGLTRNEVDDMLIECYRSTKVCSKMLFPDRFYAPFSSLHDQIFEAIDSGERKVAIAAPRGIGKTSIVGLGLAGKSILFRDRRFIPYVSKSFDNSVMQTENLKRELVSNKLLRVLFDSIKAKDPDGLDEMFSKKAWVASSHTLVLPRGSGQQIRGVLYVNYRPDLIVVDDLEDPETIANDEQRKKRKEWFHADLEKAVSRIDKNWRIIYIDTLKHEDSLLQDLLDSSEWTSIRLEICDDELNPTAPEFFSKAEIQKEYNYHKEHGILDIFYREYRNIPISLEDASFKPEYFKSYDESVLETKNIENFIIVDPAKTVKLHSAHSAIICVGIDLKSHSIYVRDVVGRMMYPDEMYEEIFVMAAKWRAHVVGIEVTSLQEFITQPLKNEMSKRGVFFELIELQARAKKEERARAMVPYYRSGHVYHNPACCQALEAQLLSYPRPKRWDLIDALAYFVEMLDRGERYFEPPAENPAEVEAQYDELDYEDALEMDEIDEWHIPDMDRIAELNRSKMARYGYGRRTH